MTSPRLDAESDVALFRRHKADGDHDARDALIERHLPMARGLAGRYAGRSEAVEDLEQVAALGLVKAIDRFDPSRGIPFRGYAIPTILGELKRHFRDATWSVRPARRVQELAGRVARARDDLTAKLRRSPTPGEIAEALGCDVEAVLEAHAAWTDYRPASLDAEPVPGDELPLIEHVGEIDHHYELVEDALSLAPALRLLPPRDRTVLRLRFEEELTQAQIGARVGMSQMNVSRVLRRSLARLHAAVEQEDRELAAA